MKYIFIIGTRPEYIKLKPVIEKVEDAIVICTCQQPNLSLQFNRLDVAIYYCENWQHDSLQNQINWIVSEISRMYTQGRREHKLDYINKHIALNLLDKFTIIVQGDTTSAFCGALFGFLNQIPVYHVEAGMRSSDLYNPFPEEGFRRMISQIATKHFCTTESDAENIHHLIASNLTGEDVHVVGSTTLDEIDPLPTSYSNTVLITLHRRENWDKLSDWFHALSIIADHHHHLEFVVYKHTNPAVTKHYPKNSRLLFFDPVPHQQLISHLRHCRFVITDSGGLQEEAVWLQKRVLLCRETTERQEGIDSGHILLCPTSELLLANFEAIVDNPEINSDCPFGDGKASQYIKELL